MAAKLRTTQSALGLSKGSEALRVNRVVSVTGLGGGNEAIVGPAPGKTGGALSLSRGSVIRDYSLQRVGRAHHEDSTLLRPEAGRAVVHNVLSAGEGHVWRPERAIRLSRVRLGRGRRGGERLAGVDPFLQQELSQTSYRIPICGSCLQFGP